MPAHCPIKAETCGLSASTNSNNSPAAQLAREIITPAALTCLIALCRPTSQLRIVPLSCQKMRPRNMRPAAPTCSSQGAAFCCETRQSDRA